MLEFMAALYNEDTQIFDLVRHVQEYVDKFNVVDDGSTDSTAFALGAAISSSNRDGTYKRIDHTGLPETVKSEALKLVRPDSWVVMLDADERFAPGVLDEIVDFLTSNEAKYTTHVWFTLQEYIDGEATRQFQKCRLFRASAAHFSTSVHEDDTFTGDGASFGWTVLHNKTKEKQIQRETEYIATYERLLAEGKITQDRVDNLKGMHYFVK